jgi:hypothetical protein
MNNSFLEHKKNVYSQNGEDGIIEHIFNLLGIIKGGFIEIGAGDGKHFSNCCKLIDVNWSGILIEGNHNKTKYLHKLFDNNKNITIINKMVLYDDNNNLDTILNDSIHANKIFDFISINVGGLDYYIFRYIKKHLPKVFCIYVNPGHHPLYDKEFSDDISRDKIGQSLLLFCKEADKKGYFPLCYTGQIFFIQKIYKEVFIFYIDGKQIEDLYIDFLTFLDKDKLKKIYDTYVIERYYNGIWFDNKILKDYYISHI